MKMKNTTMWVARERCALARSSGRISSADAPVVPTRLASTARPRGTPVLTTGVPTSAPRRQMPPEIANSAPSSAMNDDVVAARAQQQRAAVGAVADQVDDGGDAGEHARISLLRLLSHSRAANSGSIAISIR